MSGYKTYAVMVIIVLYGITGFLSGNLDANAALLVVMNGLGLGALRHGLTTATQ